MNTPEHVEHDLRQDQRISRNEAELTALRSASYQPRRRRGAGLFAAALVGAGIAAAVVSSWYDDRSIGQRIDATVDAAGQTVQQQVDSLKSGVKAGAATMADEGAATRERIGASLSDAGITAAVKTALAADPALSALRIEVATRDGVVTLAGPAPDEKARERAAVLAGAPEGVRSVDNRLVVTGPGNG